jgi:hypothetical protein
MQNYVILYCSYTCKLIINEKLSVKKSLDKTIFKIYFMVFLRPFNQTRISILKIAHKHVHSHSCTVTTTSVCITERLRSVVRPFRAKNCTS